MIKNLFSHLLKVALFIVLFLEVLFLTSNISSSQVARQKIGVSSEGVIEWHRDDKYFLATDNAKITILDEFGRTVILEADKIKVDHNNKSFEQVKYITASGSAKIIFQNLEIFGDTMFINFEDNSLVVNDKSKDEISNSKVTTKLAKLLLKSEDKAREVEAVAKRIKVQFSSISGKEFKEMTLNDEVKLTTTELEVSGSRGQVTDNTEINSSNIDKNNQKGLDNKRESVSTTFLITVCEQVKISMTEVRALTDCVNYNTKSQKLELSGRSRILQQ